MRREAVASRVGVDAEEEENRTVRANIAARSVLRRRRAHEANLGRLEGSPSATRRCLMSPLPAASSHGALPVRPFLPGTASTIEISSDTAAAEDNSSSEDAPTR